LQEDKSGAQLQAAIGRDKMKRIHIIDTLLDKSGLWYFIISFSILSGKKALRDQNIFLQKIGKDFTFIV
jgi:hypothetical protein